ncbi:MAG: hypothetical protein PHW33_01175 [Candidatus Portnoybacteria bacterium]|nr:hypothetical protein [Candidatus Portnoybacteria bacterium]
MMDKLKKLMQAEIEMGEKQIADVNRRLDVLRAAYAALTEPMEKPRRGRPKGSTSITAKKMDKVLQHLRDFPQGVYVSDIATILYGSDGVDAVVRARSVLHRLEQQQYIVKSSCGEGFDGAWTVVRANIPAPGKKDKKQKKVKAPRKLTDLQRRGLKYIRKRQIVGYLDLARKLWGVADANKVRQARTLVYKWKKRGWVYDLTPDGWGVKDGLLD